MGKSQISDATRAKTDFIIRRLRRLLPNAREGYNSWHFQNAFNGAFFYNSSNALTVGCYIQKPASGLPHLLTAEVDDIVITSYFRSDGPDDITESAYQAIVTTTGEEFDDLVANDLSAIRRIARMIVECRHAQMSHAESLESEVFGRLATTLGGTWLSNRLADLDGLEMLDELNCGGDMAVICEAEITLSTSQDEINVIAALKTLCPTIANSILGDFIVVKGDQLRWLRHGGVGSLGMYARCF